MLGKRLRETGTCTDANRRPIIKADLYQGSSGAWQVEVKQLDGPGQLIERRYETEADARANLELAYEFGRQQGGTWRIQTASDYIKASLPNA